MAWVSNNPSSGKEKNKIPGIAKEGVRRWRRKRNVREKLPLESSVGESFAVAGGGEV